MKIFLITQAKSLPKEWDLKCENYFQKRKFLIYCEKYNPCQQKYYCLYENEMFVSGCIVYKLEMNLFTFIGRSLTINSTIIGLPLSVSCSGIIGKKEKMIDFVFKKEKGLVLIMNVGPNIYSKKNRIESLPTVIFHNHFKNSDDYINRMRKTYRRRFKKAQKYRIMMKKDDFTQEHYKYYLQIMNKTKNKLETLSFDFFKNLPKEFVLRTAKTNEQILAWNYILIEDNRKYFFFGGLNYKENHHYCSYFNSLYDIILEGIKQQCKIIDLGQTAEIAKIRAGGELDKKYIYIHHSNFIINFVFTLFKRFFQYKKKIPKLGVFKNENSDDQTQSS